MPILGVLERVKPAEAVSLAKAVHGRFGVGETQRDVKGVVGRESFMHDDHRNDGPSRRADRDDGSPRGSDPDVNQVRAAVAAALRD
jgi:hypothetical protein